MNLRRCDAERLSTARLACVAMVLRRNRACPISRQDGDPGHRRGPRPRTRRRTARLAGGYPGLRGPRARTRLLGPVYRELGRLSIGALRSFRWDPGRAPYPGLSPWRSSTPGVFFAAGEETRGLVDLMELIVKWGEKRAWCCWWGRPARASRRCCSPGCFPRPDSVPTGQVVGPFRPGPTAFPRHGQRSRPPWTACHRTGPRWLRWTSSTRPCTSRSSRVRCRSRPSTRC